LNVCFYEFRDSEESSYEANLGNAILALAAREEQEQCLLQEEVKL
jgi:hypothetical protein